MHRTESTHYKITQTSSIEDIFSIRQEPAVLAARPEVEVEPVVGHVEPLPGVGSQAARQWRQSLVLSAQSRQDEGPVEVDGAGGR